MSNINHQWVLAHEWIAVVVQLGAIYFWCSKCKSSYIIWNIDFILLLAVIIYVKRNLFFIVGCSMIFAIVMTLLLWRHSEIDVHISLGEILVLNFTWKSHYFTGIYVIMQFINRQKTKDGWAALLSCINSPLFSL
jgi:hypothetical protein